MLPAFIDKLEAYELQVVQHEKRSTLHGVHQTVKALPPLPYMV
jgi:hypothetical protein